MTEDDFRDEDGDRDDSGYADIPRVYDMLNVAHIAFHAMPEPDADSETALLSLNNRDFLIIGMALPALEVVLLESGVGCLSEANAELQHRIMEILRVQKPHWLADWDGDEGGEDE